MVRNMVIMGGSSHPKLTEVICNHLGVEKGNVLLSKFAVGETRVEIFDSVRGKDVFIIQSGGGKVNDHLIELLIAISACKTASARRVTVVLPLFPYSRQSDIPYNKVGAPLAKIPTHGAKPDNGYTFDSRPATPIPGQQKSAGVESGDLRKKLMDMHLANGDKEFPKQHRRRSTVNSVDSERSQMPDDGANGHALTRTDTNGSVDGGDFTRKSTHSDRPPRFEPQRGYKQWVAQAGTLVADLLTCAGADHIITMDLHDPQYQGFFDIPVDNLYGRHILRKYIEREIPNYLNAVIVSPDAGGAKRATAIADALGMPFALIHKVS